MSEVLHEETERRPFTPINAKKLIAITLLGAVVGLAVWALALVLNRYMLGPVLCQNQNTSCVNVPRYAEIIASVIAAAIGLFFLVRLQVFRPLLVAAGTLISLWGIIGKAELLPWYGIGLSTIVLYAFSYMVLAWIARIRVFWVVIFIMTLLIIGIRLVLSY